MVIVPLAFAFFPSASRITPGDPGENTYLRWPLFLCRRGLFALAILLPLWAAPPRRAVALDHLGAAFARRWPWLVVSILFSW